VLYFEKAILEMNRVPDRTELRPQEPDTSVFVHTSLRGNSRQASVKESAMALLVAYVASHSASDYVADERDFSSEVSCLHPDRSA